MINQKHTSKVETWDYVAETYLEEITDSEEEIADTLISIIQCLCNQSENISAIELGSGSGHLSTLFAKQGIDVTLLDFSPKSLDFAKKMFSKHSVQGNYICQDLFDLHIDKKYDIVWNCGVLEHFNDGELDEIKKQYKPSILYSLFLMLSLFPIFYIAIKWIALIPGFGEENFYGQIISIDLNKKVLNMSIAFMLALSLLSIS